MQTEQTAMTTAQFAQATWERLFNEKQTAVELTHAAWMRAQDDRRANKKQEKADQLQQEDDMRRRLYYHASGDLMAWLKGHPMPEWKATTRLPAGEQPRSTDWREQEKALGVALMSVLKRPPTGPEFEEARSLFHYSLGQFEEVFADVARERETAAESVVPEEARHAG
jgi:hypothetical protein